MVVPTVRPRLRTIGSTSDSVRPSSCPLTASHGVETANISARGFSGKPGRELRLAVPLNPDELRALVQPISDEFGVGFVVVARELEGANRAAAAAGKDEAGADLTIRSVFPMASVTKLATALAAHRLIQSGRLGYRSRISEYIRHPAGDSITIAQLLSHTAGLPTDGVELKEGHTWDDLRPIYVQIAPESEPGRAMKYSNVGYCVLGAVLEAVTGLPFHELIQRDVLAPLGMRSSTIGSYPSTAPAKLGGQFQGYNHPWLSTIGLPSSGLYSPAWDALRLVEAFARNATDYLFPEIASGALGDQTCGVENSQEFNQPRGPWGLGPEIRGDKTGRPHVPGDAGRCSFGHIGSAGSQVWLSPERGVAWAILSAKTIGQDGWHDPAWTRLGHAILTLAAS